MRPDQIEQARECAKKWRKSAAVRRRQAKAEETRWDRMRNEAWAACYEQCAFDLEEATRNAT